MTTEIGSLTDPDRRPCEIGPLEAFSDEIAPEKFRREPYRTSALGGILDNGIREKSAAVTAVLNSRCCGWVNHPTSREFYEAVRNPNPTDREKALVWTWIDEAPVECWVAAWREGAYSWRMLARAFRLSGNNSYDRMRILNTFTVRPELIDDAWLPWIEKRPPTPEASIRLRETKEAA